MEQDKFFLLTYSNFLWVLISSIDKVIYSRIRELNLNLTTCSNLIISKNAYYFYLKKEKAEIKFGELL